MDIEELLRKAKEEHGGIIAFTGGALLALMLARQRKAHGVIWWLVIGLPGLLVLFSLALVVAMGWAIVFGATKLYAATVSGNRRNDAEMETPHQDDVNGGSEQIGRTTSDRLDQNGITTTNELGVPSGTSEPESPSIEQRLRRLDSLHEQGLINQDDFEARKQAILSEL